MPQSLPPLGLMRFRVSDVGLWCLMRQEVFNCREWPTGTGDGLIVMAEGC